MKFFFKLSEIYTFEKRIQICNLDPEEGHFWPKRGDHSYHSETTSSLAPQEYFLIINKPYNHDNENLLDFSFFMFQKQRKKKCITDIKY
ncbi:hypothetical protein BpHYR1_039089 [Brachionus plicatilis]|uniref:Uncharacterized protein n=1 Tax=Brachionus plicatilis TaxID=10195 RepID=A0A3M7RZI1_BRAPC|nr:hypothetical protein BpHYR1_039089 [Brachionus plicatilis]